MFYKQLIYVFPLQWRCSLLNGSPQTEGVGCCYNSLYRCSIGPVLDLVLIGPRRRAYFIILTWIRLNLFQWLRWSKQSLDINKFTCFPESVWTCFTYFTMISLNPFELVSPISPCFLESIYFTMLFWSRISHWSNEKKMYYPLFLLVFIDI